MKSHILKIYTTVEGFEISEEFLINVARSVYRTEKISSARKVNLVCCSDYRIRRLNKDYRAKDKVTDVLSFPFDDSDLLGEIYISIRRTEVQARRYGFTFREEFLRLFVHGLLHLAGYDHIKKEEREIMEKAERNYLMKFFPLN